MSNPIETAMRRADTAIAFELKCRYAADSGYERLDTKTEIKTHDGKKVVIVTQECRVPTTTAAEVFILTTLQAIVII